MKNTFKLSAVLLSMLAIMIMMLPGTATAAAPPTYPTSINGMPVILVETSANDVSLSAGQVILVLLDDTSAPMSASDLRSMTKSKISNYLNNNPISGNPCIQVYGGPGITKDSILKLQKEHNNAILKNNMPKLDPIDSNHGFQVAQNCDPQIYNNLDIQECDIIAPVVTPGIQDQCSYFGNNVMANAFNPWGLGYYFLQSGMYWCNANPPDHGYSNLVWADVRYGLTPKFYNMLYVNGDTYTFDIYYDGPGNNGWQNWIMSCYDNNNHNWAYTLETEARGTSLRYDENTSVFFENMNVTNTNWWTAFNWNYPATYGTVSANYAYDEGGSKSLGPWTSEWDSFLPVDGSLVPNPWTNPTGKLTWHLSSVQMAFYAAP